ncbi:MAG: hypothetical protein WC712_12285 [Candidatus Brocadiia bacterium]
MTREKKFTEAEFHRQIAAALFNKVWEYMEKPSRTREETDEMIHAAHASRYHWGRVGTPVNLLRGEWQISRAYSVVGRPESALAHANRCLELCREHEIGDFDLAFAHEAIARAHSVARDFARAGEYLAVARQAAEEIKDSQDRNLVLSDLATIAVE